MKKQENNKQKTRTHMKNYKKNKRGAISEIRKNKNKEEEQ